MFKLVSVSAISLAIVGCATTKVDPNYQAYLSAQKEQNSSYKQEIQLVRIKAQPGATIQMTGVDEFVVSMPANPQQTVQQQTVQPSVWAGVLGQGLGVAGTVLGIKYAGQAAIGLSNSVGNAANAGYKYVQSPQPNITETIGGNGVIGAGTYNASPVSNTTTLSGTGVLGSGTYASTPTSTTTTSSNTNSNNPTTVNKTGSTTTGNVTQ